MCCDRRTLVRQSPALAGALIVDDRDAVVFPQAAPAANGDLITRMDWMNAPESVKREGDKLIVRSRPKTDFWRKRFTAKSPTTVTSSIYRLEEISLSKRASTGSTQRYTIRQD